MRFLLNPISGQLTAAPSKEIVYSDTAPFAPLEGLRWADTTNLREYIFTDGYWVEVGVGFVGPIGPTGLTGATGTAATVAVGATTTGAAGTSAAVSNSGTSSAATLNFTIPKGVDGINGAVGPTGDSAYQSAVKGGYAFSEAAWVASLKGVKGDAATVAVGTTTTGAAGTSAAVSNSGTTSAAVFNFTVPKGDVGATGTAATVAVGTTTTGVAGTSAAVSNSGTSSAATLNFTIPRGDKGADGTSVVIKGSVATSASLPTTNRTIGDVWIASDTGLGYAWSGTAWSNVGKIQGPACTVAVGTTTTGVAGTSASVSNSGTSSAAVFNFTIPKGEAGVAGPQGIKGDTGLTGTQGPAGPAPSGTGAVVVSNGVLQTPIRVDVANVASTLVQRDASGNFSAGTITGYFSGNVTGNVTGGVTGNAGSATKLATARSINVSGDVTGTAQTFDGSANITIPTAITANSIVNADINSAAAIVDTKLANIATAGKVSNSATTATSANTANAIVARDNSGNFSAGTITANLTGSVSGNAANVTGIVAIANGGTGSTTAAAALIALGAAATSHQHGAGDITSGTLANAQLPARLQAASQTISDWNNALENGWYQGNAAANAPGGVEGIAILDWWLGCVETHYDRWVTQTVHRFTIDAPTNTHIWRRSSEDSGATVRVWGAWYKLQLSQGEQDARYALRAHTHGGISNAGAIGATASLPIITGPNGVLQAGAFGTTAGTFCQGSDARLSDARSPLSHTHGGISNAGAIGVAASLPIITGTNGVLQAGAFGTTAGTFCQGNDARLSDARYPLSHTHLSATTTADGFMSSSDKTKLDGITASSSPIFDYNLINLGDAFTCKSACMNSLGNTVATNIYSSGYPDTTGEIKVYRFSSVSESWVQLGASITYPELIYSFCLSPMGDCLAIGSASSFKIYNYSPSTQSWVSEISVSNFSAGFSGVAQSLSFCGNGTNLAVGYPREAMSGYKTNAGTVRVYSRFNQIWSLTNTALGGDIPSNLQTNIDVFFGNSVAMASNSKTSKRTFVVGAPRAGGSTFDGWVKVYSLVSNVWTVMGAKISGADTGGQFGYSVAINADGTIIAVGAPKASINSNNATNGIVKVYRYSSGSWSQMGSTIKGGGSAVGTQGEEFGTSVSLNANGNILLVGSPGGGTGITAGAQLMYEYIGNSWVNKQISTRDEPTYGNLPSGVGSYSHYGSKVFINSAGSIISGATDTGFYVQGSPLHL